MSPAPDVWVPMPLETPLFDTPLNHWDETAAYAALCCLAVVVHHAAAW